MNVYSDIAKSHDLKYNTGYSIRGSNNKSSCG